MKRFKFNLEKVLDLRAFREKEARIELGRAVGALTAIENRLRANAESRATAAAERFSSLSAGGLSSMFAWDGYILRLEREAALLQEEAARAELVVQEKRALYIEASRELKVMEKLREKRAVEYRREMFARQTAEMDDLWRKKSG